MTLLVEANFNDVEVINESVAENNGKNWYISGVFAQADVVNRNRRLYPKHVLDESFDAYQRDYVSPKRAVGELTHPATTVVNLDRITHIITEMKQDGNSYIGKAKILNTPCGKIVQALLEGGVQLGVSTRANGTVSKNRQGIDEVAPGLSMSAIDIVYSPSAPDAFVTGLMEGADFVWDTSNADHNFVQALKEEFNREYTRQKQEAKFRAFQAFMEHIKQPK